MPISQLLEQRNATNISLDAAVLQTSPQTSTQCTSWDCDCSSDCGYDCSWD